MNKVEEELRDRDEEDLGYLDSVAVAALPGVIRVLGRSDSSGFTTASGVDIGKTCYDVAWSMLDARRAERKLWEEAV
ncbi:hypothetical protein NR402_14275 [Acidithiobacillus ferrooxidans]|uniref:hypothetical protein n=1 Tax=Acidithiobacillus ferrooxidans TaxID=920 RepID=UPI001C06C376|nr:hypothetical protein [Acidithiobacillus ferrooxidans]MBU2859380.1 hypothetical protein [Acidithiobacillus ferrooxidans]MCR2831439.1 hypothetical protein [Acidithiobacillus ferrooxidans]